MFLETSARTAHNVEEVRRPAAAASPARAHGQGPLCLGVAWRCCTVRHAVGPVPCLAVPPAQAFINTAREIYKKIQDGVFDVTNEVRRPAHQRFGTGWTVARRACVVPAARRPWRS